MFSTVLGKSRQQCVRDNVLRQLENVVKDDGGSPSNFVLEVSMTPDMSEDKYRMICCHCKVYLEQVLCDWSRNYDLDSLIKTMLQFSKDHRHGPTPVPSVEPVAAVVEYLKGYRKFREV
jgi:hypothetical protein